MNAQRAQEIASSPVMANVTHNGIRVYIQRVDAANEVARVYPLGRPEDERDVPLNYLTEH